MLKYYPGQKLSIFIGKNDTYEGIVLYELLLEIAFNSRLSGGTVTIGDKGFFGAQDESTQQKILRSSEDLPVVLEFQGTAERIDRYIQRVQPMIKEGLLTLTDVRITKFNRVNEDTDDFENSRNEDQAKIFKDDDNISTGSGGSMEDVGETVEVDQQDPDPESQSMEGSQSEDEEAEPIDFLEPDEAQPSVGDVVPEQDTPIEKPAFDDIEQTFKTVADDQQDISEDATNETSSSELEDDSYIHGKDENTDIPGFQSLEDQPGQEDVDDILEDAGDSIFEEVAEEEKSVLQLADLSETQAEESEEDVLEAEKPFESGEKTFTESEFTEPKTEDEIDALFEENSEKFESTFEDMLKQAGQTSAGDVDASEGKTVSNQPGEVIDDVAAPADNTNSKPIDGHHTEEEMKSYFSRLFKRD